MKKSDVDYLIIGAGVIGLATALALKKRSPTSSISIIEKESEVASHASGRNSGVLHAGIYYSSSSLKAKFCVEGNRSLRAFCLENHLPINECGKFIVASNSEEYTQLEVLYKRGLENGCTVSMLSPSEAAKIEPNLSHFGDALYSPLTASVDPVSICKTMQKILESQGVLVHFNCRYEGRTANGIKTTKGIFEYGRVINCAGLYADKIASDFGFGGSFSILPFKGMYLKYSKNRTDIKTHIYPVPNPAFPFLGVHFTKTVDGTIKIGPTAIPAFWRENYSLLSGISLRELSEIFCREAMLFASNAFHFRDLAFVEMKKYYKPYFVGLAQKLVKQIDPAQFNEYSKPGIRAQLLDKRTGELVQDFIVEGDAHSVHILNAVSPGFTCCIPFAEYVVDKFGI